MNEKLETKYGLPENVVFCKRCVMSNQRPASAVEFKHTKDSKKITLNIDEEGIRMVIKNSKILVNLVLDCLK